MCLCVLYKMHVRACVTKKLVGLPKELYQLLIDGYSNTASISQKMKTDAVLGKK